MADRVTLRWIASESLKEPALQSLHGMLSAKEQARAANFHHAEDRRDFIAAHALTRGLLSERTGRPPQSLQFNDGPFGKPALVLEPGEPRLAFNLSHTRGCAIVALGVDADIGVDIECTGRPAPRSVAHHYFAPQERAALLHVPEAAWDRTFYSLWTLKEAYMKATGKGMSLALDRFVMALDPPRLVFDAEAVPGARWQFVSKQIGPKHIAALAIGRRV